MPGAWKGVNWRKPSTRKRLTRPWNFLSVSTVRSLGIATFLPTVPVKIWLRGLPMVTVSGLGPTKPRARTLHHGAHGVRPSGRRGALEGRMESLLVPTGQGWTWQVGLSTYRLNILILQPQLPISGTDLISAVCPPPPSASHDLPSPLQHA